jgi:colanic acid/amylovoran biosynthesis glycosyltransferase
MKIAYFVLQFPALSETFVLNQITGLIDLGHSVDIYALRRTRDKYLHPDIIKYQLLDRTKYFEMPKKRFLRIISGFKIAKRMLMTRPRLAFNSINPFINGYQAISLKLLHLAACFDKPYDIMHCHFGPVGRIGSLLKDIEAPIKKYLTSFHAADLTVYLRKNDRNSYQQLFKNCDLILPISYRWKDKLIELGCDKQKIKVHRMGVNCKLFNYKKRGFPKDGAIKLISVARLVEKKGIEYGIRAISNLIKENKKLEYNIVGDGPLKTNLYELIKKMNIKDNVRLLGKKTQNEVRNLLDQSHILLAPSVTAENGDQEGIPVALMEAMAMGLPVISTQHSGIPELIENGVSGLLVPERDVEALTEALRFSLNNPSICEKYSGKARSRIEQEYDIDKLNIELEALFSELLSNSQGIS